MAYLRSDAGKRQLKARIYTELYDTGRCGVKLDAIVSILTYAIHEFKLLSKWARLSLAESLLLELTDEGKVRQFPRYGRWSAEDHIRQSTGTTVYANNADIIAHHKLPYPDLLEMIEQADDFSLSLDERNNRGYRAHIQHMLGRVGGLDDQQIQYMLRSYTSIFFEHMVAFLALQCYAPAGTVLEFISNCKPDQGIDVKLRNPDGHSIIVQAKQSLSAPAAKDTRALEALIARHSAVGGVFFTLHFYKRGVPAYTNFTMVDGHGIAAHLRAVAAGAISPPLS